jgi:hypothetical protein
MIFASKTTFSLNNLKILRPKVTKILQICLRSFVNFHPDIIFSFLGSISPIFYAQPFQAKIPKAQKVKSSCQYFLALLGSLCVKALKKC